MGTVYNKGSSGRTPVLAYSSTASWALGRTNRVTIPLPAGNYYINVHMNYNGGGRVTGDTTWTITNATAIYNDNGTGNYSCNALFQGLFTTNGNDVAVSCTNTGSGTYPVVITVYKV
jgi:hypothetical protein